MHPSRQQSSFLLATSIVLLFIIPGAVAPIVSEFRWSPPPSPPPPRPPPPLPASEWQKSTNLGVRVIKSVYAVVPATWDGRRNVTVSMTIWLKRVGGTKNPYDMPHQANDALRMMIWVDNPHDLHRRKYGHLKLPTEHTAWMPQIRVETAEPGPVLTAVREAGRSQLRRVGENSLRPFSLRVDLPPGTGHCFKIVETSYPKHKAPVCLPPAHVDNICNKLAPPDVFTATKPALYMTIAPVRHAGSWRDWRRYHYQIATRLANYVPYHTAMGASGLLLYTDELTRYYLTNNPLTMELIRDRKLWLVEWDMPERAHDDTDGHGRPLGYNYDQALFASHAMLALSSCGTNMMLTIGDLDEYIYFPKPDSRWPDPLGSCMATRVRPLGGSGNGTLITVHQLQRFEVLSTRVPPLEEAKLWMVPGTLGRNVSGATGGNGTVVHPMARYDLAFRRPLSRIHGKPVVLPAGNIVLFFVHEGVPVHGQVQLVHSSCMVLLHVPNYFRGRHTRVDMEKLRKFRHWMFVSAASATP